jgi:hypothetical protein
VTAPNREYDLINPEVEQVDGGWWMMTKSDDEPKHHAKATAKHSIPLSLPS